jgi:hypothetical protein
MDTATGNGVQDIQMTAFQLRRQKSPNLDGGSLMRMGGKFCVDRQIWRVCQCWNEIGVFSELQDLSVSHWGTEIKTGLMLQNPYGIRASKCTHGALCCPDQALP